jgi:hypothetical protein
VREHLGGAFAIRIDAELGRDRNDQLVCVLIEDRLGEHEIGARDTGSTFVLLGSSVFTLPKFVSKRSSSLS